MTWGKIRFLLLQSFPGSNLDLLDAWMNGRYLQILKAADWTDIHARATLMTQAAYKSSTDSATFTVGSATVTGSGTTWTDVLVGQKLYRNGDVRVYTVTAVASGTSLTIDRAYEGHGEDEPGVVYAASAYVFMQNIYSLPSDLSSIERILDSLTNFPLFKFTAAEMDESAGTRAQVGYPETFCQVEDTTEVIGTAPTRQVELYPPPEFARGLQLEYLRDAYLFNGLNLQQSPLPFVSDACIMYGVKADICADAGKVQQAEGFEAKFNVELARLLRVEFSQRRAKPTMRMAPRFVRHRLERAARGYNYGWNSGTQ